MRLASATVTTLILMSPAAAQNLRDVTLIGYSVHTCQNAPEAVQKLPDCNGDYRLYFSPKGLIYFFWYGAGSTGLMFQPGRSRTVTTQIGEDLRVPVKTRASFDGGILALAFSFDHARRLPNGDPQRNSWTGTVRFAIDGPAACRVTDFQSVRYISQGGSVLQSYSSGTMREQHCRIEQGRK